MADKDSMLAQFQDVTGSDMNRASFFLESSNWDLERALGSFYENEGEDQAETHNMIGVSHPTSPSTASMEKDVGSERRSSPPIRSVGARGGVGANVGTLFDRSGKDDEQDDSSEEDKQGQAFYAGGSTTSGQQILGPPKKKGGADFVKDMFKMAREHGAEAVESASSARPGSSANAFHGTGFRLGSDPGESEQVEGEKKPPPPRNFVLKMWKNGFSVDNGDLRPYNDASNREFLSSVMIGRIPKELLQMAEGGEVHVDMEDHKEEDYVKPKGTIKSFSGVGYVLGGIAPEFSTNESSSVSVPSESLEKMAQEKANTDSGQPVANIQIRLPDGKRLVAKLNHSHTVGDLRNFVSIARPDLASRPFAFLTIFPSKELEDEKLSIKDAGLMGAAIMMRHK